MKVFSMRALKGLLLGCVFAAATAQTFAQDNDRVLQDVPEALANSIMQQLKLARPDFEYSKIRNAPIEGLYQVQVISGPVLYVTADAQLLIAGDLFSIDQNTIRPYEHPAITVDRAEAMATIDRKEQIVFAAKGETRAYVNVFTDTTCGYCRKLHNEIAKINELGIEVRYMAYPREGLDSKGYHQLVTAWCSKDRQGAMTQMKNGEAISQIACEGNPVAKHYQIGQELGVSGTPALILADGRLLPGYVPAVDLARMLGLK